MEGDAVSGLKVVQHICKAKGHTARDFRRAAMASCNAQCKHFAVAMHGQRDMPGSMACIAREACNARIVHVA